MQPSSSDLFAVADSRCLVAPLLLCISSFLGCLRKVVYIPCLGRWMFILFLYAQVVTPVGLCVFLFFPHSFIFQKTLFILNVFLGHLSLSSFCFSCRSKWKCPGAMLPQGIWDWTGTDMIHVCEWQ